MLQHLPVEHPQEPLSHLQVGPQGHPALALAAQAPLAQPHLPVAQPQSPSLQAQEGPQVQGILVGPFPATLREDLHRGQLQDLSPPCKDG
jgi:hypothetical protein